MFQSATTNAGRVVVTPPATARPSRCPVASRRAAVLTFAVASLLLAGPASAVTGTVRLNAEKAGSPTRFVFAAFPGADKQAVALTVAFPRGTAFVRQGTSCPTAEPFRGCPKQARLGYGAADWTLRMEGARDMACEGTLRAWNAAAWRGFVLREILGPPCPFPPVYYDGRFKRNVLTFRFFDHAEGINGARAVLTRFALNGNGTAGARVPPLRTPRTCDGERGWKTVVTVKFEDGSKESFARQHRCHR